MCTGMMKIAEAKKITDIVSGIIFTNCFGWAKAEYNGYVIRIKKKLLFCFYS